MSLALITDEIHVFKQTDGQLNTHIQCIHRHRIMVEEVKKTRICKQLSLEKGILIWSDVCNATSMTSSTP